jgi:hypothetical protein
MRSYTSSSSLSGDAPFGIVADCYNSYPEQFKFIGNRLRGAKNYDDVIDRDLLLSYNSTYAKIFQDLVTRHDLKEIIEGSLKEGIRLGIAATIICMKEGSVHFDFARLANEIDEGGLFGFQRKEFYENPLESKRLLPDTSLSSIGGDSKERSKSLGFDSERKPRAKRRRGSDLARSLSARNSDDGEQPDEKEEEDSQGNDSTSGSGPDNDSPESSGPSD